MSNTRVRLTAFVLVLLLGGIFVGITLRPIQTALASGIAFPVYGTVANAGVSVTQRPKLNFVGGGCVDNAGTSSTDCTIAGTAQLHSIGFVIDNGASVIATGDAKVYPTAAFACTITRIDISAAQSGSITVDVWKAAGAIPTAANKISASAPLTLSTAQLAQNGSRTGWTSAVSSGDVFGFNVVTVATVTRVVGQIWCN